MRKFLRTGTRRFLRLGRNRRKNQKWRSSKGIHGKIREKRKGRPRKVEIGFGTKKQEKGKVKGKVPVMIRNLEEAQGVSRGMLIIIGRIGRKKRLEIEQKVREKGGEVLNIKKYEGAGKK